MTGLKATLKKIPFLHQGWVFYKDIISLNRRLRYLERRVHNDRWYAIEQAADYLVGAQVDGDYCEFGVYKGDTFAHMAKYHHEFPQMRFFAFDSFEGLPAPKGIDIDNGYSSNFTEGQFAVSEEDFLANLRGKKIPLDKVTTVKGWYDKTLPDPAPAKPRPAKVACAWIDCDYYESTVPVLQFLTSRLAVGSLLLFDDWKVYRNLPDKGQQRATSEWLAANPGLELIQIFDFGHHGRAFTVAKVPA